jgi:hypothetical protein
MEKDLIQVWNEFATECAKALNTAGVDSHGEMRALMCIVGNSTNGYPIAGALNFVQGQWVPTIQLDLPEEVEPKHIEKDGGDTRSSSRNVASAKGAD